MTTTTANFEANARTHKVLDLVAAIDDITIGKQPTLIYSWVMTLSRQGWLDLANIAGCKPASPTTQAMVIGVYEKRAFKHVTKPDTPVAKRAQ